MTPEEAILYKNRLHVFMNIALKANRNRPYPPLKMRSAVQVLLKHAATAGKYTASLYITSLR